MHTTTHEWRCRRCGRLLGIVRDNRLEIRFARGHQYLASLPVTCVCKNSRCNALNELAVRPDVPPRRSEETNLPL